MAPTPRDGRFRRQVAGCALSWRPARFSAGLMAAALWAVVVLAAAAGGCGPGAQSRTEVVVIFAAASTGDAVDELGRRFEQARRVRVQANYGATSALAQQISHAAEADVFLSANTYWADYLEKRGLVVRRCDLLTNQLVIVVPADWSGRVNRPEELLSEAVRHIAIADPEAVPAGMYAKAALEKLGLWEKVQEKLAPVADVRRALAYVETGAAEAGLVYASDAAGSNDVRVAVKLDAAWTGMIRYPLLLLKGAEGRPAARLFFQYLTSAEAAEVFQRYGFGVLAGSQRPPK